MNILPKILKKNRRFEQKIELNSNFRFVREYSPFLADATAAEDVGGNPREDGGQGEDDETDLEGEDVLVSSRLPGSRLGS